MSEFVIKKAQRASVRLKIFLAGPSGSGKTKGALWLARSFLGPTGRICVIDTERESASFYAGDAGIGEFDTLPLAAPYHTDRYIAAIDAVIAGGYDFCIIDSTTHQWSGVGGVLERKEQLDARGGNNFTNWAKFTPETEKFRNALLEADINLIATVRSKQEYAMADEGGGKKSKVQKLGMKPEQREGLEYEFAIGWQLQMDNRAEALKDRTGLFAGKLVDLRDPKTGLALRQWVDSGAPDVAGEQRRADRAAAQAEIANAPRPAPAVAPASAGPNGPGICGLCEHERELRDGLCAECRESVEVERELLAAKKLPLKGKDTSWIFENVAYGQKPIGECPTSVLKQARHFFKDLDAKDPKPWIEPQLEAIALVLADREKEQTKIEFPEQVDAAPTGTGSGAALNPSELAPGKLEDAVKANLAPEGEQRDRPTDVAAATDSDGSATSSTTPATTTRRSRTRTTQEPTQATTSSAATAVADPPAKPTIGALSRRISEMLMHEKFGGEERTKFRARLDAAESIDSMQALVDELQNILDLPF